MPAFRLKAFNLVLALIVVILGAIAFAQNPGYVPKEGFVPDEKTAIAITEAILTPIYGQEQVASEVPFHATLDDKGVWTVKGRLPKGWIGGVALVKISRKDGRILHLEHGK